MNQGKLIEAMETLRIGKEIDPDCVEIREMILEVDIEIE
jgi:hypothetical protein